MSVNLSRSAQFQQGNIVCHACGSFVTMVRDNSLDLEILFCSFFAAAIMSSKSAKLGNVLA